MLRLHPLPALVTATNLRAASRSSSQYKGVPSRLFFSAPDSDICAYGRCPIPSPTLRSLLSRRLLAPASRSKLPASIHKQPQGYLDHRGSLLWAGACVRSSVTDVRTPASRHHYMIDVCRSVSRALHARRDGSSPREGNSRNGRRVGAGLTAVFCSSRDLINQTPGDGYATAAAIFNNTSTFFQAWS